MGQWVDLDILHKFYPINKSKEELRAYLLELERGNFLKPTDTEGVWECNMVGVAACSAAAGMRCQGMALLFGETPQGLAHAAPEATTSQTLC
jgi:hypothetical protein